MENKYLKEIPSVSEVLHDIKDSKGLNNKYITYIIKSQLEHYRSRAKEGKLSSKRRGIKKAVIEHVLQFNNYSLKSVINGTGIVLHTGLGRAPIDPVLAAAAGKQLSGYVNIEYNLKTGERGDRLDHINDLLCALTGAEKSLVVNNNAGAVLISLNTAAEGKEVIISRGQQVEIGGSFRIPDIIKKSGCILKEVGTTNRTHLIDYEKAVSKHTACFLWVHTSNYVVKGFTHAVELSELVELGQALGIPVIADLGSGAMANLSAQGLPREILVSEIVKTGVDIVTFSGDKLLGGPQSGILVGKKQWINKIFKNALYRALRCDKWTIALLESTLKTFQNDGPSEENSTLNLLTRTPRELIDNAGIVMQGINSKKIQEFSLEIIETVVEAGSGSLPEVELKSAALKFNPNNYSADKLARTMRTGIIPVAGYIKENCFYIDMKAILPEQLKKLSSAINDI
ncbi:MAG: L-seryl-tRNA(Sec) selenium transferase [Candidatus Neomarinimicrobiota bacterium]